MKREDGFQIKKKIHHLVVTKTDIDATRIVEIALRPLIQERLGAGYIVPGVTFQIETVNLAGHG